MASILGNYLTFAYDTAYVLKCNSAEKIRNDYYS